MRISSTDLCDILTTAVGNGQSIHQVAAQLGTSRKRLFKAAKSFGLRYRNRRPSKEQIKLAVEAVLKQNLSVREAAEFSGVSRSAVNRYVLERRRQIADSAGSFRPKVEKWRCPIHGQLSVFPCVACAAQAAKSQKAR